MPNANRAPTPYVCDHSRVSTIFKKDTPLP
jgi:hypothetical protein